MLYVHNLTNLFIFFCISSFILEGMTFCYVNSSCLLAIFIVRIYLTPMLYKVPVIANQDLLIEFIEFMIPLCMLIHTILAILAVSFHLMSYHLFIGKRLPNFYLWTESSYSQRANLHRTTECIVRKHPNNMSILQLIQGK